MREILTLHRPDEVLREEIAAHDEPDVEQSGQHEGLGSGLPELVDARVGAERRHGHRQQEGVDVFDRAVERDFAHGGGAAQVVAKGVGPVHKSDVGGVVLNIKSEQHLALEFDRMMQIPEASAIMVQPMLKGTELFIGAKYEEKFGHVVLCGLGGIFVEVLKDISSGLAPLSYEEAYSMIHSLRAYKIIKGTRGQKGVNEDKFAEIIVRLSTLLRFATEIKEMDINPLLATEKQVIAVDARIRIEKK